MGFYMWCYGAVYIDSHTGWLIGFLMFFLSNLDLKICIILKTSSIHTVLGDNCMQRNLTFFKFVNTEYLPLTLIVTWRNPVCILRMCVYIYIHRFIYIYI